MSWAAVRGTGVDDAQSAAAAEIADTAGDGIRVAYPVMYTPGMGAESTIL